MKTRRNKIIGLLLSLAIIIQGIAWPVSALDAEETLTSSPAVSDTQLTDESELENSEALLETTLPAEVADEEPSEPSEAADTTSEIDDVSQVDITEDETREGTSPATTEITAPVEETSTPTETEVTEPAATTDEAEVEETEATTVAEPTDKATTEEVPTAPTPTEAEPVEEPSESPEPTSEPAPTADPNQETAAPVADEDLIVITADNPLIGPMFVGAKTLLRTAIMPMSTGGDGLELTKTATYNTDTGKVDFEFQIYSTGEISTVVSTKPVDIILVLDQSGSMDSNFGQQAVYTAYSNGHSNYYSNRSTLYALVNGRYLKVTVERTGGLGNGSYRYSYQIPGGDLVRFPANGTYTSGATPPWAFYRQSMQTITRIQALKNATTAFVNSIRDKALAGDSDGNYINHRISIVGFSQPQSLSYQGTEILTVPSGNPIRFNNINDTHRSNSLMDVTTTAGQNALSTAIGRINTYNWTSTDLGMLMAKDILSRTAATAGDRDRIVVMLTDGVPTVPNNSNFDNNVANRAIGHAREIKAAGHNIFTIGIFPEASNSSLPGTGSTGNARANRFMHLVSSNYLNATNMDTTGSGGGITRGFYFAADADPEKLYETFETISETVGEASMDLPAGTSMIDYLIPQLSPPINPASITIRTSPVTGFNSEDQPIWGAESNDVYGAVASVDQTLKSVRVTGFPYNQHFVAKGEDNSVTGRKLIVRFSADVDPDFIGGNVIYPNLPNSGVYLPPKDSQPPVLVEAFEQPDVDIPLRYDFLTQPKSIYLKNSIEPWKLLQEDGTRYLINGNQYTLNGENNEYVNITYTITNLAGTETYGSYSIPAGDTEGTWSGSSVSPEVKTEYLITATVTPISAGTYSVIQPNKKDFIYVYTPQISPTDKSLYLTQETNLAERFGPISWISLEAGAPPVEGTAPAVVVTPVFKAGSNPSTHGLAANFKPQDDSYFDLKLEINGADVTARSTINATPKAAAKGHKFGVFVFYPAVVATDETIWLGENTNVASRMTPAPWWTTEAGITLPTGAAPVVSFNPVFLTGDNPVDFGGTATFAATRETRFNIQSLIGATDVTNKTRVTASPHGTANGHHFTIFVRTASLTIKKEASADSTIDPNQTFLFDVVGPGGKTWTVAIQGTGSRTITGLAVGQYSITENEDWSWRYTAEEPIQNVTLSRHQDEQNRTVLFKNRLDDDQWLGGETVAINVYNTTVRRLGGAIVGIFQWIGGLKR